MASIQIGNYKRPGIFQQEYDDSIIASQTVQGIVNTVIGVSRKGPINTPVLISNTTDLQNIFGSIDRNLERKGSFFHRTIAQMIQSSPVWAINLLATDDTLDTIQYAPISTSTDKTNDIIRTGSYRRFFDNTGFWKKDTDSFLTVASANDNYGDRLFNLTNMSGNYVTAFVFKSTVTGYDISMLTWYSNLGDPTAMPPYVYPTDYVSDYMVDVVVVAGDWSNYQTLSVDPRWSKYFDSTGLLKGQVTNFTNDVNVTLLKYYQGLSFIPYFKDNSGQNIFIETVINQDTDATGLFCAFNMDAFDTDFPNGKVDLIGNNLVNTDSLIDSGITSIDFLSYNDSIIEFKNYTNKVLDAPGNVYSMDGSTASFRGNQIGNLVRTDWYAEDLIVGVRRNNTTSYDSYSASIVYRWNTSNFNGIDTIPYAIIGGNKVNIAGTGSFTINAGDFGSSSISNNYYVTYKLDTTGTITQVESTTPNTFTTIASTDVALGYMALTTQNGAIVSATFTDVTVATSSYIDLVYGNDYTITSGGSNNTFTVTFLNTAAGADPSNYKQYRAIKRFNAYRNILESVNINEAVLMMNFGDGNGYVKVSLNGMIISTVTSSALNKSFTIQTNLGLNETVFSNTVLASLETSFVMYAVDNEQILSDYKLLTTDTISSILTGTNSYGIVAKYSNLYQDFYNGLVNTGDYFYANVSAYTLTSVSFLKNNGNNYIVIAGTNSLPFDPSFHTNISVPSSVLNTGTFVINDATNFAFSIFGLNTSFNFAYKVEQAVTTEILYNVTSIYDTSNKYYLSMYMDGSDNLTVKITDSTLSIPNLMGSLLNYNQSINVVSDKSNYQETVEIVIPSNYTQVANKVLVLGSRYTNVKVGDFLEAYVDISTLAEGQAPKTLTRILSKRAYTGDSTLAEITCDARIATYPFGSGFQTMKYSTLDNYVTTYKAITLQGFRIREASLPDGTETRQSQILNLVASGTPLFGAITNKDAFDFRYLIDSFGLGLTELSKQQLVDICGERLDCLGFINMPSIKSFKNSSSPSFMDTNPESQTYGTLLTSYIAAGGNIDNNPAFLYSFGQGRGVSCVGYFTPYVTVDDNGRPLSVPPAMFVATTYMRKLNTNVTSTVPWTIAAGITDGRIANISGVEMDFTNPDIDNLNGAMMNPIVIKKNRGWVIETENTAQTLYKSALSFLHVREVLIELERALAAMLLSFQWKFNTPDIRAEIKLRADTICAGFVNKNGLYNYFNKCDSENNTNTLIDNQIGVLDTYVEPIKGMAVIVNNITVLKTGAIASGGFSIL